MDTPHWAHSGSRRKRACEVFVIAMNHAICQGFSQGDFNVNFVSSNTSAFLYENH